MDATQTYREMLTTLHLDGDRPVDPTLSLRATTAPATLESLPIVRMTEGAELGELRVQETLGEGGVGVVRRAVQAPFERDVAVKTVRPDRYSEQAAASLFHEALTTGRLEHPHIIPIYALGRSESGRPVIVMRRIRGRSWREVLLDPTRQPLETQLETLLKVCDALEYAHSLGILHRDIKPDNIMLGAHREVYVVDWGIATHCPHVLESAAGTPAYMAPEMTQPGQLLDERTDVFLLGALLYELLCGRPPYHGKTLFEVMYSAHRCEPDSLPAETPGELARVCRTAMARSATDRFESVGKFREAIESYLRHRDTQSLLDRAHDRADKLREATNLRPDDLVGIQRLFAEARFGMEEAAVSWPENTTIRPALDRLVATMCAYELEHGSLRSARALFEELDEKAEPLMAQMERRQREEEQKADEFARLQALRSELDLGVSSKARAVGLLSLTILWTFVPLLAVWGEYSGWWPITMDGLHTHGLLFFLSVAVAPLLFPRTLFANLINQRIAMMLIVSGFATVLLRSAGFIAGLPIPTQLLFEMITYWLGLVIGGILVDRRIGQVSIAYLVGALATLLWPAHAMLWLTFSSATVFGVMAMVWRSRS